MFLQFSNKHPDLSAVSATEKKNHRVLHKYYSKHLECNKGLGWRRSRQIIMIENTVVLDSSVREIKKSNSERGEIKLKEKQRGVEEGGLESAGRSLC